MEEQQNNYYFLLEFNLKESVKIHDAIDYFKIILNKAEEFSNEAPIETLAEEEQFLKEEDKKFQKIDKKRQAALKKQEKEVKKYEHYVTENVQKMFPKSLFAKKDQSQIANVFWKEFISSGLKQMEGIGEKKSDKIAEHMSKLEALKAFGEEMEKIPDMPPKTTQSVRLKIQNPLNNSSVEITIYFRKVEKTKNEFFWEAHLDNIGLFSNGNLKEKLDNITFSATKSGDVEFANIKTNIQDEMAKHLFKTLEFEGAYKDACSIIPALIPQTLAETIEKVDFEHPTAQGLRKFATVPTTGTSGMTGVERVTEAARSYIDIAGVLGFIPAALEFHKARKMNQALDHLRNKIDNLEKEARELESKYKTTHDKSLLNEALVKRGEAELKRKRADKMRNKLVSKLLFNIGATIATAASVTKASEIINRTSALGEEGAKHALTTGALGTSVAVLGYITIGGTIALAGAQMAFDSVQVDKKRTLKENLTNMRDHLLQDHTLTSEQKELVNQFCDVYIRELNHKIASLGIALGSDVAMLGSAVTLLALTITASGVLTFGIAPAIMAAVVSAGMVAKISHDKIVEYQEEKHQEELLKNPETARNSDKGIFIHLREEIEKAVDSGESSSFPLVHLVTDVLHMQPEFFLAMTDKVAEDYYNTFGKSTILQDVQKSIPPTPSTPKRIAGAAKEAVIKGAGIAKQAMKTGADKTKKAAMETKGTINKKKGQILAGMNNLRNFKRDRISKVTTKTTSESMSPEEIQFNESFYTFID